MKVGAILVILFLLHLLGCFFLFGGFFPLGGSTTSGSGQNQQQQEGRNLASVLDMLVQGKDYDFLQRENQCWTHPVNSSFELKRIVFIVVDALGSIRFENTLKGSEGHKVLASLHSRTDKFRWYTSYAHAPTVTLPKLRAMVNGQMSNFVDVVMNVVTSSSESEIEQTNGGEKISKQIISSSGFLYNLRKEKGWKLVLHGDETWFRLVSQSKSKIFDSRSDSTHSLYVTDTVIVDDNVTRHVLDELETQHDWNFLVLHYLGLDHLGHTHAEEQMFLDKFQYYNDLVFEPILSKINLTETLFVLGSDHGMTTDGGHGGSTTLETNAMFGFLHDAFSINKTNDPFGYLGMINQIDYAPTISLLTNISIPERSVGKLILEVIKPFGGKLLRLTETKYIRGVYLNKYCQECSTATLAH